MKIDEVMLSGNVERFHQAVGITKQKLSEHQWGVAILLQHFFPKCDKQLIMHALTHDIGELYTGDIPATTKWSNPKIKQLVDEYEEKILIDLGVSFRLPDIYSAKVLKLCDCLEGMNYCAYRYEHGEKLAIKPFYKWNGFIVENLNDLLVGKVNEFYIGLLKRVEK